MNITNMKKLIEHLETQEEIGFAMSNWFVHQGAIKFRSYTVMPIVKNHICDTSACLAGHAAILAWNEGKYRKERLSTAAELWLDLDACETDKLFYGGWETLDEHKGLELLTVEEAIIELKYQVAREED